MKDFSELSPEQVNDIIERYYNGEGAEKLIKEYDLDTHHSYLYKLFPPEITDNLCEYCNVPMLKPREAKSSAAYKYDIPVRMYCPKCLHKPYSYCSCDNCLKKARSKNESMRAKIVKTYSLDYEPIKLSEMSFTTRVFLGALVRAVVNEDLYNVLPYTESHKILSPTSELDAVIYKHLRSKHVILVDPSSPLDSFDIKSPDFPNTFYVFKVKYLLNLSYPTNKKELFDEIISPQFYNPFLMAEEALDIWKTIALHECLEYLKYRLEAVRFDFTPGEKSNAIFRNLLKDYSVSQIYAIIWHCISDASRDFQEHRMSRTQAGNSVVSRCQKYGERAKHSNWEIAKYSRIRDLPQSEISLYFFNQVVKIGNKGFDNIPNLSDLGDELIENEES